MKCDLTKYRIDLLQTARSYLRDNSLRGYCYSNAECRLMVKNADNENRHTFSNFADFRYRAEHLNKDINYHKKTAEAAPENNPGWLDETIVVNLKTNPEWLKHPCFTYIGRRSKYGLSVFGNPFKIPPFSLEESLRQYENHVRGSPNLMALLPTLKGRILGCFCHEQCHGDVLVRLIKELWFLVLLLIAVHNFPYIFNSIHSFQELYFKFLINKSVP